MICKYCKQEKPEDGFKMCVSCRKKSRQSTIDRQERVRNGLPVRKYNKFKENGNSHNKKSNPNIRLDEKIKELNRYNEEHGTRLTYGKYMGLVFLGKIDKKR